MKKRPTYKEISYTLKPLTVEQWKRSAEGYQRELWFNQSNEHLAEKKKEDLKAPRPYDKYVKAFREGEKEAKENTVKYWTDLGDYIDGGLRKIAHLMLSITSSSPPLKIKELHWLVKEMRDPNPRHFDEGGEWEENPFRSLEMIVNSARLV